MRQILLTTAILLSVIVGHAQQTIELNNWKFKTGDNPEWTKAGFDDSDWQPIKVGIDWQSQAYPNYEGYAWYRIKFVLPSELKNDIYFSDSLLILLGKIDDFDQTFLNGKPLGLNGKLVSSGSSIEFPDLSKMPVSYNILRNYTIPSSDSRLLWGKENVIAVRVFSYYSGGGLYTLPVNISMKSLKDYLRLNFSTRPWIDKGDGKISKTFFMKNLSPLAQLKGKLTIKVTCSGNPKVIATQDYDINLRRDEKSFTLDIKADKYQAMSATCSFYETMTQSKTALVRELRPCEQGSILIPSDLETPYKLNRLVISASGVSGNWDEMIDCPFVFRNEGKFYMTYIGFDGKGYQTGLASSDDLINWKKEGVILRRAHNVPYIHNNIALLWIVRENDVFSEGNLKKINGKYLGVYFANPGDGFESGAGAIGLCWSSDLYNWEVEPPFLKAEDGAEWEKGGLYKPCLVEENGVYYLFYNAKSVQLPGIPWEKGGWHEQIGIATSTDLKHWERYSGNPILHNGGKGSLDEIVAGDPCVLRYGNQWALFYYCFNSKAVAMNRLALLSPDMHIATKCESSLLECGPLGSIDESAAMKPSVIFHNNVLYHFYGAVSQGNNSNGISVQTSKPINSETPSK